MLPIKVSYIKNIRELSSLIFLVILFYSPAESYKGKNSRKKMFNFSLVPEKRFFVGRMGLKNLMR